MIKLTALFFLIMFVIGTDTFFDFSAHPYSSEIVSYPDRICRLDGRGICARICHICSDSRTTFRWMESQKSDVFRHGLLLGFNHFMRLCDRILDDVFIPFFSRSQRSIHSAASLGLYSCFVPFGKDRQSIRNRNGRLSCFPSVRHTDWRPACCNPLVLSFFYNRCVLVVGGDIHPLCFARNETESRPKNQASDI